MFKREVEGRPLDGSASIVELPARTRAASPPARRPNVTYEKEHPGTFELDAKKKFFQPHRARSNGADGDVHARAGCRTASSRRTTRDGRFVSYYGDNHPRYAGNVVKAMASAKDGYPHVVRAVRATSSRRSIRRGSRRATRRGARWSRGSTTSCSRASSEVKRLTPTIVEVIVHAPAAARHFQPGPVLPAAELRDARAPSVDGTRLMMEGIALTGAWVDTEQGLLSLIVARDGRLVAAVRAAASRASRSW